MENDTIVIHGQEWRVVSNWNAFIAFLRYVGRDSLTDAAGGFGAPSDIAPLMAACINEGCRLDGKDKRFTPEEIGEVLTIDMVNTFMDIYGRQSSPNRSSGEQAKKK